MNECAELQQMLQVLVHRGDYAGVNALFPKALDHVVQKLVNHPHRQGQLPILEEALLQKNWHFVVDLLCELLED